MCAAVLGRLGRAVVLSTVRQRPISVTFSRAFCRPVDGEDGDGLPKDYKSKVLHLSSRRLDTFVSRTTGHSKQQAEKLIISGKVQLNETEVQRKKAYNIEENDIVDVWNEAVEGNSKLAEVHRIEVVGYTVTESGYNIDVKSWKRFYVPNWRV